LPRVITPTAQHASAVLIAEVSLDVKYFAEHAVDNGSPELAHRGKAPLVVAERQQNAGVATGGNRAFRLTSSEGKWLFTPYRFSGFCYGNDLIDVQRMGGCEHHSLYVWVGNRSHEIRANGKAMGGRKPGQLLRLVANATNEVQPSAFS